MEKQSIEYIISLAQPEAALSFLQEKIAKYYPELQNSPISQVKTKIINRYLTAQDVYQILKVNFQINHKNKEIFIISQSHGDKLYAYQILKNLYQNQQPCNKKFLLPRPLEYISELETLVYEPIAGETLLTFLSKNHFNQPTKNALSNLAKWLTTFQRAKINFDISVSPMPEMDFFSINLRKFKHRFPDFHHEISQIVDFIKQNSSIEKTSVPVLSHGDFNLNNIIVNKNKLGVIDFERVHYGYPLWDVGSFLAQTYLQLNFHPLQVSARVPKKIVRKINNFFIKEYDKLNGGLVAKNQKPLLYAQIFFLTLSLSHLLACYPEERKIKPTFNPILKSIKSNLSLFQQL